MKLSVENHTLRKRYGDETAIKMLKEAGFDSIDYSYYWLEDTDDALGSNYIEHAVKVRQLLDENCMTCNQAHAPFALTYGSTFDLSEKEYAKIVRSMESAAILGAEHIVVHSLGVPNSVDCFAYNLGFYKSLEPYCEKFGIRIAIENLFEYDQKRKTFRKGRLHTPELLNGMIKALNSPWFVVCIDVGHAAVTGFEPEELIQGFDHQTLKSLHIHDNDYLSDRHALPCTGDFNWDKITGALKSIDYNGDFTLEIFAYLNRFDDEMMQDALMFAGKVGRHLMKKIV